MLIQLRLPLTETPRPGTKTRACRKIAAAISGTDTRFQVVSGIRVATRAAMTPATANCSCLRKTV